MTDAFLLPNRSGRLPDEMAYLRDKYPRPDWPAHANFEGAAAFWILQHNRFRQWGGELGRITGEYREGRLAAAGFRQLFVPRLNTFLGHLEGHHNVEDYNYFPLFRARDERLVRGFDLLENDHGVIHDHLERAGQSAVALLSALAGDEDGARRAADEYAAVSDKLLAYLLRHLEDEEDLIVPTILEHTDGFLGW